MLKLFCLAVLLLAINANFIEKTLTEEETKAALEFWSQKTLSTTEPIDMPKSFTRSTQFTKITELGGNTTEVKHPYTKRPHIFTGKLFLELPTRTASCSASAIGGNRVITAGHCVYGVKKNLKLKSSRMVHFSKTLFSFLNSTKTNPKENL
jgi:V8-like Glu-specific endopeptidase